MRARGRFLLVISCFSAVISFCPFHPGAMAQSGNSLKNRADLVTVEVTALDTLR